MRIPLLLVLGSLLALTACDSTTDEAVDLMTRAPWVLVDAPAELNLAERYDFRDNGTLTLTFADGATLNTRWALDDDGTVLVVREPSEDRRYAIETLTETDLVLENGGTTLSFVHAEAR